MTEADRQRQHVTVAYTATLRRPNDNGLIFSAQEFSGRRRFIFGPLSTMTAFQINVNGAQMDPPQLLHLLWQMQHIHATPRRDIP